MKVSILLVVKNKKDSLRNVLYSIVRQKTSFPYEVCVLDVNSSIELEPFIREFIPDVRYKKLDEDVNFIYAKGVCLDLADPLSDVIVIQGEDVIQTQDFALEDLCKQVGPKTVSIAEVLDIPIDKDFHKRFEPNMENILFDWGSHIYMHKSEIDGVKYTLNSYRTGKELPAAILFFLGAIRREDLSLLDFQENNCDAVIGPKMKELGFKVNYPDVKGIHQRHIKISHFCPVVDSCQYHCIRKVKKEKEEEEHKK